MARTENTLDKSVSVTFEIGLDTHIGDTYEMDGEGDRIPIGEVTFADVIADKIAQRLAAQYANELRTTYGFDPRKIAEEAIAERVEEIVSEALTKVVQTTTAFGEPVGEPRTVAEILSSKVGAYLRAPADDRRDGFGTIRSTTTNLEKIVASVIDRDTSVAIKKATVEARDIVMKSIKADQEKAFRDAVDILLKSVTK